MQGAKSYPCVKWSACDKSIHIKAVSQTAYRMPNSNDTAVCANSFCVVYPRLLAYEPTLTGWFVVSWHCEAFLESWIFMLYDISMMSHVSKISRQIKQLWLKKSNRVANATHSSPPLFSSPLTPIMFFQLMHCSFKDSELNSLNMRCLQRPAYIPPPKTNLLFKMKCLCWKKGSLFSSRSEYTAYLTFRTLKRNTILQTGLHIHSKNDCLTDEQQIV